VTWTLTVTVPALRPITDGLDFQLSTVSRAVGVRSATLTGPLPVGQPVGVLVALPGPATPKEGAGHDGCDAF
jgi:hypothetical protein